MHRNRKRRVMRLDNEGVGADCHVSPTAKETASVISDSQARSLFKDALHEPERCEFSKQTSC